MPEWIYSVSDQLTEPTKKMGKATDELSEKVHKSSSALELFASIEVAKAAYEGTVKVYEWAKSFTEFVIEVHDAEAASKRLLDVMAGGKGEGTERFEELQKWSRQTKFTVGEIITYQDKLFQFTKREGKLATDQVLLAASDLATLGPGGKGKADALIQSFATMDARAKVTGRALVGLAETGVISQRSLGEAMAQELALKGPKAAEQALDRLEKGTYDRTKAMNLALKAVNKDVDFDKGLGTASMDQAVGSVSVSLKNLKESWDELFEGQDITPLSDALNKLSKAFDPSTESGKHLRAVVEEGFTAITRAVDLAASRMDHWISLAEKAVHVAEALLKIPKFIFNVGYAAGGAVTSLATGDAFTSRTAKNESKANADQAAIEKMNAQIEALQKSTADKVESNTQLEGAMKKAGINAGSGFMEGLANSLDLPKVIEDKVIKVWDEKTETHSPSKVFERRGMFAAQGLNIGFANNANLQVPGFGVGSFAGLPPAGGRAPVTIQVTNNFAGGVPTDPNQVAQFNELQKTAIENVIVQHLDRMAQS